MAITIQYYIIKNKRTLGVDAGNFLQNDGSWGPVDANLKTFSTRESAISYADENLSNGVYFIKDQILKL
jgi:hypothetical protein